MGTPKPKRKRNTRQDLVEAAIAEFETVGFEGTNTNRIARAAGYAPQTFYRHFDDKKIDRLAAITAGRTRAELAADLLKIERLADAIAEGEFEDLQIGEDAALSELAQLLFWIEAD